MTQDLLNQIDAAGGFLRLADCRVPVAFLRDAFGLPSAVEGMAAVDIEIGNGAISSIAPAGTFGAAALPMAGRQVWPVFADLHTHLDKTYIAERAPNRNFSLLGAVEATRADYGNWSEEDLQIRAGFALQCAYVHGTAMMRSHVDSLGPQAALSWQIMTRLRDEWAGRIDLQFVAMAPIGFYLEDRAAGLVDRTAHAGGLLGGVTRVIGVPHEREPEILGRALEALFSYARSRDMDIDLHVDETLDPRAATLEAVAAATDRHGWAGRVTCGHCCSLSVMASERQGEILEHCANAGVRIVSLPLVNSYLQDRSPLRTPLRRGLAPLQEIAAHGVDLALASDNCGDPFHPYGDYDLLEVLRETTRTGQLDDNPWQWARAVTTAPARAMARDTSLAAGASADLVIFAARSMVELVRRPQADRIVLRKGKRIMQALPCFSELDRQPAIGQ